MYYEDSDEDNYGGVYGNYCDYQLNLLHGRERAKKLVLKGDGSDFLSAVWKEVQEGTSSARTIHMTFKDEKEICICSTVLTKMSEYFKVMLGCGMRETVEGKVTLPTVTHLTFTRLMAYTLGQRVEIEGREELVELLQAAEMMQMPGVLALGTQLLQKHLSESNWSETLEMVQRFQPDKVKKVALFIISNIKQISKTDEWCSLKAGDVFAVIGAWKQSREELVMKGEIPAVISAVFRWIDAQRDTSAEAIQLLQLIPFDKLASDVIQEELAAHPSLAKNRALMDAVQELVRPKGEITLLVIGSAENRENFIYCWSDRLQDWFHFPPPPQVLPRDFAVVKYKNSLVISGGINEDGSPSKKVWIADKLGWKDNGDMSEARSRHGTTVYTNIVYIAGGLPGPLQSVERFTVPSVPAMHGEAGSLSVPVYDCSMTEVGLKLIVVGGTNSQGPQNIIQTLNLCTRAAEVFTLPVPAGLALGMGFTHYIGTMGSLLFLCKSGHVVKVEVGDDHVTGQVQVLLKDFHHQPPFAALLDDGWVVVCDRGFTREWCFSLDGHKKEKTTLIRRFRNDISVFDIFRFFLPSEQEGTQVELDTTALYSY